MPSLRGRLLAGTMGTCAGVFVALGVALDTVERRTLQDRFDESLRSRAVSVASMVEWDGRRVHFDFDPSENPEFAAHTNPQYFEVWVRERVLARSESLGQRDLSGIPRGDGIHWAVLPDGREGRVLTMVFSPIDETRGGGSATQAGPAVLAMGRDTVDLDRSLERLRWTTIVTSAAGLALLMGVLAAVVHWVTRPVGKLSRAIGAVDPAQPGVPLVVEGMPAELSPVVERLNGLLSRLAEGLERERSFTADVAHELRTPLAGIRATLEVCRTRPRAAGEYEAAIDRSMAMVEQMESLVRNMLMLARADSGHLVADRTAVDVGSVLQECCGGVEPVARERRLTIAWDTGKPVTVQGDRQLLTVLLGNLVQNAVTYAPAGSVIEVHVVGDGATCEVRVENAAGGLTTEDVGHFFERFWRKDAARSGAGLHSGLGLSLCRRLATLMGGEIGARLEGERLSITLTLPCDSGEAGRA
jgi:two-component system sensor histidine kinase QseC